jgi:hypothetical protein
MWIIPIIAGACYLIGGQWWKPGRWLMGIPIFFVAIFNGAPWWAIYAVVTYLIATNAFPYGEKSWLNFLGEYGKYIVCGIVFGLASAPILGYWSIAQAILGGGGFGLLHYLDEKNIVKNPFQEILRGVVGTALFVFF